MGEREPTPRQGLKARLLLVDSHVMVRQALTMLISQEPDLTVCGGVSGTSSALGAIVNLRPDLVVTEIGLRSGNGLEMIKNIAAQYSQLPVLVLSMHEEGLYAGMALRAGAKGYIMKDEPLEELLVAVRRVLNGKIYLSEEARLEMASRQVGRTKQMNSPEELLSDRELQEFQLIGQWYSTS